MSDDDRIDQQVRHAVESLPDAPVRWERVARRARRRTRLAFAALLLVGLVFTLALALSLLAGKSAIDPSFSPPLISGEDLSIDFSEPGFGHGLTPLSKFRLGARRDELEEFGPDALGYVFRVLLTGNTNKARFLSPRWRIRHRGNSQALRLRAVAGVPVVPVEGSADKVFEVWIERPPRSGQFVVDFSLISSGGVVANATSSPLHVVTKGLLRRYASPTYTAGVPDGWHVASDYESKPGHRFVTRLEGPHEMSVLIDTTLDENGDPADSAIGLEGFLEDGEEPYKRLNFARRDLGGPALEWSYELGDHVSTDIFFYRGKDGYAVLAESPESRLREARLVARAVARSLIDGRPGSPNG